MARGDRRGGGPPQDALAPDHRPERIAARLSDPDPPSLLRDIVLGAIDGAVTTFAIVMGAAGAHLDASVILVLGFVNVLADGFSMAVGNVLATRAETEELERARATEREHIERVPEGEREEVRKLYRRRGFEGELLEQVVEVLTADVDRWVDTMVVDELGLPPRPRAPMRAGVATFAAFVVAGCVPLAPFVIAALVDASSTPIAWSVSLTAIVFLAVGAARARLVGRHLLPGAVETLMAGGGAALLAYGVGVLLGDLTGGG